MEYRPESYLELLGERDANGEEWHGQPVVREFDDGEEEYWRIRRDGAGLVDRMARGTLVVTGDEAVPWLQGLVTSDLLELREKGAGLWTCATDVNGRVVSDMRLLHLPEMLVVDVEPGALDAVLRSHLEQQIIMEDVALEDRTETAGRLGVYGPAAAEIVGRAGEWRDPVDELTPFSGTWGRLEGRDVVVQRLRLTGAPCYDLTFAREAAGEIWMALERAGGDRVGPAGSRAVETARCEAGIARFGEELDDGIIPLEAGLEDLISFEKGCYTGQEVIARLDTLGEPAKLLRTLVFDGGAAPRVGASVEDDGREVGEVANAVWSPLAEAPIALAYLKRGSNELGTTVEVEGRSANVESLGRPLARN